MSIVGIGADLRASLNLYRWWLQVMSVHHIGRVVMSIMSLMSVVVSVVVSFISVGHVDRVGRGWSFAWKVVKSTGMNEYAGGNCGGASNKSPMLVHEHIKEIGQVKNARIHPSG
jgi:hypothetical protein